MAVCHAPHLLDRALQESGAIGPHATVRWISPLSKDRFVEYRDVAALQALGITELRARQLSEFWPPRGPVWDGLGVSTEGLKVLLEAKAHIAEAASPTSAASKESLQRIEDALHEARAWYAPRSAARWSGSLYQYANRLAFHYFLAKVNGIAARMIFLDFYNAEDVEGPSSPEQWKGATEMIHALLGLPKDLSARGVFHAYVDVRELLVLGRGSPT
ncbi:MAG: hypothetical protein K0S57_88 [Ramlibacter sp.]|nr:hypothetical protein [Ramlibacter sp.]